MKLRRKTAQTLISQKSWIVIFWLYVLILVIISACAYWQLLPASLTANDKLGHFILLGTAGFFSHQALNHRMLKTALFPLPLGPVLVSLVSAIDEFLQIGSTVRSFDLVDLSANLIGIWLFYAIAETCRSKFTSSKPKLSRDRS